MPETTFWICDSCGERINRVEDGWVEWIVVRDQADNKHARDLRLVHHRPASPLKDGVGCQINGHHEYKKDGGLLNDMPLSYFVGPDGLMHLLALLADEEFPRDIVLEMIKRLHIPGYEIARNYFQEAMDRGVFEPNMMPGYYHQCQIEEVINYINEQHPEHI